MMTPTAVESMKILYKSLTVMILTQLQQFRQALYNCLGKARDAVFELMDAVLVSPSIPSFVSLSQSPVFRRQWPSIYAALHDSRPPRGKLMKLLVREIATDEQPFLAGDHSIWLRPDAQTLRERTFHSGSGESIGIGQSYSTLAWVPETSGSWALPLRHERITSFETPTSKAAFQLKQVTRQLGVRPLAAYDRGYGNANFVQKTEQIEADLLLRLASNRCVWSAPGAYQGRGARCKHGHKFKLNDPETWPEATEILEVEDPKIGRVKLMRWSGFHFRQSPKRAMEIIRVEVTSLSLDVNVSLSHYGWLGLVKRCPHWKPSGSNTCDALPWNTGIAKRYNGCIGHNPSLALLRQQSGGVT